MVWMVELKNVFHLSNFTSNWLISGRKWNGHNESETILEVCKDVFEILYGSWRILDGSIDEVTNKVKNYFKKDSTLTQMCNKIILGRMVVNGNLDRLSELPLPTLLIDHLITIRNTQLTSHVINL